MKTPFELRVVTDDGVSGENIVVTDDVVSGEDIVTHDIATD